MQFKHFIPVLPVLLAFATPSLALADSSSSKTMLADIKAIESDIKAFNDTLNKFSNSPLSGGAAVKIGQEGTALEDALTKAAQNAQAAMELNKKDSQVVRDQSDILVSQFKSLLENTIAHHEAFTKTFGAIDLTKQVQDSLINQRNLSRKYSNAVAAKLSTTYVDQAVASTKKLMAYFKRAIDEFDECTGLVCAPY